MAGLELKKSGRNNHANFDYYELGDFLPAALKKMSELKMLGVTDFIGNERFVALHIMDAECEDPGISFYTEKAAVIIQGAQRMQNIGGEHTYQRRYLWMDALELAEPDTLDAVAGKKTGGGSQQEETKWIDNQQEQTILAMKTLDEIDVELKRLNTEGWRISKDRIKRINERKAALEKPASGQGQTDPPSAKTGGETEDKLYCTYAQLQDLLATTDMILLKDKKDKLLKAGAVFTKIMGEQIMAHVEKLKAAAAKSTEKPKDDHDAIFDGKPKTEEADTLAELDKLL
jgi:hypothetical protein